MAIETDQQRHEKLRRDFEFAQQLMASENRKRALKEAINLIIALCALLVSFYSIFETHRDARESLQKTQRAYLTLDPGDVTTGASAQLTIKIAGQSPARKIQLNAGCILVPRSKADDAASRAATIRYSGNPVLIPGSTFVVPPCVPSNRGSSFDLTEDSYIVNGQLTYEDIFSNSHRVNFCFVTDGTPRLFPCETGNDAD